MMKITAIKVVTNTEGCDPCFICVSAVDPFFLSIPESQFVLNRFYRTIPHPSSKNRKKNRYRKFHNLVSIEEYRSKVYSWGESMKVNRDKKI